MRVSSVSCIGIVACVSGLLLDLLDDMIVDGFLSFAFAGAIVGWTLAAWPDSDMGTVSDRQCKTGGRRSGGVLSFDQYA